LRIEEETAKGEVMLSLLFGLAFFVALMAAGFVGGKQ